MGLDLFLYVGACVHYPQHHVSVSTADGGVQQCRPVAKSLIIVSSTRASSGLEESIEELGEVVAATHSAHCCFRAPRPTSLRIRLAYFSSGALWLEFLLMISRRVGDVCVGCTQATASAPISRFLHTTAKNKIQTQQNGGLHENSLVCPPHPSKVLEIVFLAPSLLPWSWSSLGGPLSTAQSGAGDYSAIEGQHVRACNDKGHRESEMWWENCWNSTSSWHFSHVPTV